MRRLTRLIVLTLVAALPVLFLATPAFAAPSNDDITGAVTIPGVPFTDVVNTTDATVAGDDPAELCFGPLATVWYTFTPGQTIQTAITTAGSDYDTTLAVFSGSPGALNFVACNDDSAGTTASAVAFTATAGTQYYIMAGTCCGGAPGQVGPGGNLVLNVSEAPPPLTVTVAVSSKGSVTNSGTATVTGTIICSNPTNGFVNVNLTQLHGRRLIAQGGNGVGLTCGPTPTAWSVQVTSFSGVLFGPGRAEADVAASACDSFTCDSDQVTRTVQFRSG
jgi:hypothetical protein